jgi:hypothetical protein
MLDINYLLDSTLKAVQTDRHYLFRSRIKRPEFLKNTTIQIAAILVGVIGEEF